MPALNPIQEFFDEFGRYPGNNKQWWVARADADDPDAVPPVEVGQFLPKLLDKLFSGNNHAPRGHFILNAFDKDRSAVSDLEGLPSEVTDERPNSIAFFSGRAWYGCNSTVYFSQVLTDIHKAGLCYQEADPTSEDLSDLIATDGGVIPIPEISKIIRLTPHGESIIVFATNGVWQITGTAGGFSALDITVNKISPVGCKSPMSVVETEEGIFWWSDVGIMGMQEKSGMYGPIPGVFDRSNISENTIQTFFNDISENVKLEIKGVFDAPNNRIVWLYRDDDVIASQYNRVLIFDITLGAFYPWKFSALADRSPIIKGLYVSQRISFNEEEELNRYPSSVEFFTFVQTDDGIRGHFALVNNNSFTDWAQADTTSTGAAYESYIETGYELFNDAMKRKNITYLFSYLRQTESEWDDDPSVTNPSSCYLTVKWDWADSTRSNKWTTPVQVYRPGRRFIGMDGTDYDTGYPIVVVKNKIRGNGRAIQFRYGTDEPNRNFDLHGWSVAVTGDTVP